MITRRKTALKNIQSGDPKTYMWADELLADEELCLKAVTASPECIVGIPDRHRTKRIGFAACSDEDIYAQIALNEEGRGGFISLFLLRCSTKELAEEMRKRSAMA